MAVVLFVGWRVLERKGVYHAFYDSLHWQLLTGTKTIHLPGSSRILVSWYP
jgi:hypothetical protein